VHELLAKLFQVQRFEESVEHASFSDSSELAHDGLLHASIIILSENALLGLFQRKCDVMVRYVKFERGNKD
jgi:hypothetical protein